MPMKPQTYIHLIILEVTSIAVGLSAPPIIPMEADSELQPNKPSAQTNVKMHATNFFIPITPWQFLIYSSLLSFYRQLRLCIAKVHRAKPPPYDVIPLYHKSAENTISLPKFVCRGDSRIARYRFVCSCGRSAVLARRSPLRVNILMRTSRKGRSFL